LKRIEDAAKVTYVLGILISVFLLIDIFLLYPLVTSQLGKKASDSNIPSEVGQKLNQRLLHLKPNQWIKIAQPWFTHWHRQGHAGAAYDSFRDVIVAYKGGGVWELGPDREEWVQAAKESHHGLHFNMDYESKNRALVVFGDYHGTHVVWSYHPGDMAGAKGVWVKHVPTRDFVPPSGNFPVAYDEDHGVFLLVVDSKKERRSRSFVYNLATNEYLKIPHSEFQPIGMNYMMVYDIFHKVFLLVTGRAAVWALKLDPEKIQSRR
jgi:hypothetical protein